jgi:hypothetical protein
VLTTRLPFFLCEPAEAIEFFSCNTSKSAGCRGFHSPQFRQITGKSLSYVSDACRKNQSVA